MRMQIEIIPPCSVAYLRHIGPYGAENTKTMERLKSWAKAKNLLDGSSVLLGIARDNPETTLPDDCRYDVCIVIPEDYCAIEGDISLGNISWGSYAVLKIRHTAEAMQRAWLDIFPELKKQGRFVDETRPVLERYAAEMVKNHYCEICVPIKA